MIQSEVLKDNRENLYIFLIIIFPDLNPIESDLSLRRLIETKQQFDQCRFSCTIHPDKRHRLPYFEF